MAETKGAYVPDRAVVNALAASGENLLQYICRHAEMVKARESKLGTYAGDGPTSEQADCLVAALSAAFETPDPHAPDVIWRAFRAALDPEMAWLFPERDPIAEPMTAALREVQSITAWTLDQAVPEMESERRRYESLAAAVNAAARMAKAGPLRRAWSTFLIAIARFLWWLAGGERRR